MSKQSSDQQISIGQKESESFDHDHISESVIKGCVINGIIGGAVLPIAHVPIVAAIQPISIVGPVSGVAVAGACASLLSLEDTIRREYAEGISANGIGKEEK